MYFGQNDFKQVLFSIFLSHDNGTKNGTKEIILTYNSF